MSERRAGGTRARRTWLLRPDVGRRDWVDFVKGAAIILIVAYHVTLFLLSAGFEAGGIGRVKMILELFPMPAFFLISGIFQSRITTWTFGELWRRRLRQYLYLYVLWSVIRFAFYLVVPNVRSDGAGTEASDPLALLGILFWPISSYWFIYALFVFTLFFWLLRRVPPWLSLTAAAVLSVLSSSGLVDFDNVGWDRMTEYFVFFLLGAVLHHRVYRAVETQRPWAPVAAVLLFAAFGAALTRVPGLASLPGVALVGQLLAVVVGFSLAFYLVRLALLSWLVYVGVRSLNVYLVHIFVIALLMVPVSRLPILDRLPGRGLTLMVGLTAAVVVLSILVTRYLTRVSWLFVYPFADRGAKGGRTRLRRVDAGGGRLGWADVARGGAMILVVLAHVLQLMSIGGWRNGWLDTANLFLTAVRMPLFFLVAGIFGANAIRRSWRGLFASRLALLIYMYVLWSVLRALWFTVVPWPLSDMHPWVALLLAPVWPTNGLWFLYALILYLVVGRATVRVRAWIPLTVAAALAVVASADLVPTGGNGVWKSVSLYAFFFLLGARLPDVWRSLAARATLSMSIVAVVVIPLSFVAFTNLPDSARPVGRVVLSIVCVGACLVVAAMIARVGWLARPFRYIGERTIAIYVSHAMLLAVLVPLVPAGVVPAVVAAVAFTAVGVSVPLVLYRVLGPLGGVFNLPRPWARWLAGRAERGPRPSVDGQARLRPPEAISTPVAERSRRQRTLG